MEPVTDDGSVAAFVRLLDRLPRLVWPRPALRVVVDDSRSRVKIVRGLPPTLHAATLGRMVAATPARFFIVPTSAEVTGVRVVEAGVVQAAVFDRDWVQKIRDACQTAGYQIGLLVPLDVVIDVLPKDLQLSDHSLAVGVTRVWQREPIALRPGRWDEDTRVARERRRFRYAAAAALLSITFALIAPALTAIRITANARHTLAVTATSGASVVAAQRSAIDASRFMEQVSDFEGQRTSKVLLLAELAHALPVHAALSAFRADSTGATVIAVASRAADVVRGIQAMDGVRDVALSGPVTHEMVGGVEIERVTVHFRVSGGTDVARVPLAAYEDGQEADRE